MIPGIQQRACPDREVGAARARVLRKRGEDIRFHHFTTNGHSRYLWKNAHPRDPHARPWSSARAALLAQWEWSVQRRASFQSFVDDVQRQFADALGIPASLLGTGPRLGKMAAPRGWIA